MKRAADWTFSYPATMGGRLSGRGLARLRLALGLLFPPLRWPLRRVADLPAPLRGVAWPAGVTPLGVYRDRAGGTFVRLRGPADPHGQARALTGLRAALLAAGCPPVPTGAVGFGVPADLFGVGEESLLLVVGAQVGTLELPLLPRSGHAAAEPGLNLGALPGVSWSEPQGAPHALLPPGTDIRAAFTHWVAQAAAQGWAAQPPLFGAAQAFTLLTNGERAVTLSAAQVSEVPLVWAAALEGDLWSHLRRRAAARQ
ncbi:hypothetical protein GCM10008959_09340 [Deinococcus seoulensis]|uniref:Uncharacterized protein n=1 Tax=Deinococcus seoulensis TaxID=1837379 RepID=A0ABQ2RMN7_9DEIO|nr:hypothetical protein [Deinococcus seoulensis]GGR50323.1 hypothetical protein GCM10008959_09340 [Deinococcus seoulensis]